MSGDFESSTGPGGVRASLVGALLSSWALMGCTYKIDVLPRRAPDAGSELDGDADDGGDESSETNDGYGPDDAGNGAYEPVEVDAGTLGGLLPYPECSLSSGAQPGDPCSGWMEPCSRPAQMPYVCNFATVACAGGVLRFGAAGPGSLGCIISRSAKGYCARRSTACCIELSSCTDAGMANRSVVEVCSPECDRIGAAKDAGVFDRCPGTPWSDQVSRCTGDFICDAQNRAIGQDSSFDGAAPSVSWCENGVVQQVYLLTLP